MEDLKYPIKYACKPLYYGDGYINGYIVLKAYLVGEEKKYYPDGKSDISYKVVFPYPWANANQDSLEKFFDKRSYPKYNNDSVVNSQKVDRIFDTYEDAKMYASSLNEYLRKCYALYNHLDEDTKYIINHFDDMLNFYNEFEAKLLSLTENMEVKTSNNVYKELLKAEEVSDVIACKTLKKYIERK